MTYSLLIVEDERWEREGLMEIWDWRELGIEIAGSAVDGVDGYEKALHLQPDIIVTDIRMPGQTGLEMARKVRTRLPDVRIVVLTGYSDYEYTREAITLHADDYVLKPLEEEKLREAMLHVVGKCEKIAARRLEESRMLERLHSGERMAAEKLLSDLLRGRRGDPEALAAGLVGLDSGLDAPGYAVMAAVLRDSENDEALRRVIGEPCYLVGCDELAGGIAIVLPMKEGSALGGSVSFGDIGGGAVVGRELERWARSLLAEMERLFPLPPLIGLGSPVLSLSRIGEAYRQAVTAARYGVFHELNGIFTPDAEAAARRQFGERSHAFLSEWQELSRRLRLHVLSLQTAEGRGVLENMFSLIRALPGAGKEYVAALLNALLIDLSMLEDDRLSGERQRTQELLGLDRLQEMHDYVLDYLASLNARLDAKRNRKDDYIAEKTIRLIEQNYGSHELSLTMLAKETFVSPNHLGVLFKKATGMTVHQYIMEVRMRNAEELLRMTKRKVSEVAGRVGIANQSYFCTLFKQKHGMSPGEYQELMQRR